MPAVPNGLTEIVATFGDPRLYVSHEEDWERRTLDQRLLPQPLIYAADPTLTITRIRGHRLLVDHIVETLMACLDAGVPRERLQFGGCYAWRPQRGSAKLSAHVWGIALDLETAANPLGQPWVDDGVMLDPRVIQTFQAAQWQWGGLWHRPDPQHFQFCLGW